MPSRPMLHLSAPSRSDYVGSVLAVIDVSLERAGADDDCRSRVGIALGEAMANAIIHGNGYEATRPVDVEMNVADDRLEVRVSDRGKGFDIDAVPDPRAREHLLKPHGRGLLLMSHVMDEVEVSPRLGGSTVTMRTHLGPGWHDEGAQS